MVVCITHADDIPDLMGSPIGELMETGAYEGTLSKDDAFVQAFGKNFDCLIINYKDADALDAAHREGCAATVTRQPIPNSIGDSAVYIKDQYYIAPGSHSEEIFTEYRKYE